MRWAPLVLLALAGAAHAAPPVCAFSCTPVEGRAPLSVECTNESTEGPFATVLWYFNENFDDPQQMEELSFTTGATVTVSLFVQNGDGTDECGPETITVAPGVTPREQPRGFRPCGLLLGSCEDD